jgi:hypothetical protein
MDHNDIAGLDPEVAVDRLPRAVPAGLEPDGHRTGHQRGRNSTVCRRVRSQAGWPDGLPVEIDVHVRLVSFSIPTGRRCGGIALVAGAGAGAEQEEEEEEVRQRGRAHGSHLGGGGNADSLKRASSAAGGGWRCW